jgi:hypothetical protein
MSEANKYRITRDSHNWIVWAFQAGGEAISRGRYAGQPKQSKWKEILFCGSLKSAAKSLLDRAAGDAVLSGEAASILDAIRLAEERTMAALEVMTAGHGMSEGVHASQEQTQE